MSVAGRLLTTIGPKVVVVEIFREVSTAATWKYHVPFGTTVVVLVPAVSVIVSSVTTGLVSQRYEYPETPTLSVDGSHEAESVEVSVVVEVVMTERFEGEDGEVMSGVVEVPVEVEAVSAAKVAKRV
jgi:hypothetical protein